MAVHTESEALIIGAGPTGLFQAFQLGLLGIDCQIVESSSRPGGQCEALYPDKPIYDIPATAYTTAADFIQQLLLQIKPFDTAIHYQQTVQHLAAGSGKFVANTQDGSSYTAKRVVVATGAGAFTPVKLRVEGIQAFEDSQVHYSDIDKANLSDKNVVVVGDNESAITTALTASGIARGVVFIHRKRRFDATEQTTKNLEDAIAAGTIASIKGKITNFTADVKLQTIAVRVNSETTTEVASDQVLVRLGDSPKQSELSDWGIDTSARHIPVDAARFETTSPGIYAVGDINVYPAKRKLILCGFHEATLAAYDIAASLRPDKPLHLQYTTTSTELLQRLGVKATT